MAGDPGEFELLRQQLQNERKARQEADERERKLLKEAEARERKLRQEAEEREGRAREEERERASELIRIRQEDHRRPRTPSPVRPALVPDEQTPRSHSTGNLFNTSENRRQIDNALQDELRNSLVLDEPNLISRFFPTTNPAIAIFEAFKQGAQPLYENGSGWIGWPLAADERSVLSWFHETFRHVIRLAAENELITHGCRDILTLPDRPLGGHIAQRKLDIGVVHDAWMRIGHHRHHHASPLKTGRYYWPQVLVVGELKQNETMDNSESTWLDLSRYARVVFREQDLRRFTLGFTLCGPRMRLWYFDRVGGVASPSFNIHEDGQMLVSVLCGFLAMDEGQLGYDPSIMTDDRGSFITVTHGTAQERIDLVRPIKRQSGIVGRATTCWEGLLNGLRVCVKDSWQYPERPEEGNLLKRVAEHGARNVARHYHHETLENIRESLRGWIGGGGRNVLYPEHGSASPAAKLTSTTSSRKRSGSSLASPHPTKRRPLLQLKDDNMRNREHRRLIMLDVGKDIRQASSCVAMIRGVIGCISGLEQCFNAGIMHCDVSIGNMMLYEDEHDGFLIDLDVAALIERDKASGAPTKTGTKVFMSIGVLRGFRHSFMDDLESVFWALFWFCAHCTGPGQEERTVKELEQWNYDDITGLAYKKAGLVSLNGALESLLNEHVSDHYRPFIPWLMRLSTVVFPNREPWKQEDRELSNRMKEVLEEAAQDVDTLREDRSKC